MAPELALHIKRESTINGLTNAFFNGLIAWWMLHDVSTMHWWGQHSFAIDILATAFLLPFIVALILIPLARRKLAANKIPALRPNPDSWLERAVARFPHSLWWSASVFGLIGLAVVASTTLTLLYLLDVQSIEAGAYSLFKGAWAGVMAFLLAGPMIMVGVKKYAD